MLLASIPDALAAELHDAGLAHSLPRTRDASAFIDIAVVGLGISTTLITISQGPVAFEEFRQRLGAWLHGDAPKVSVTVRGPSGTVSVDLENVDGMDLAQLAAVLELAIGTGSVDNGE
jgi:hypothetical protein